ncbi:MAG: SDR family oxidoreductase [Sphingobium sp.]
MKTTGNTILITGGGSGIGRGLAEAFHKRGNEVIITGRRQSVLDEVTQANPGMHGYAMDVNDPSSIETLVEAVTAKHPKLNVLFNNAGIMVRNELTPDTLDLAAAEAIVTTNLLGPIRMVSALLPHLRKQQDATIINVTSGLAFVPLANTATYCATKAAVHSWTLSLRYMLAAQGIEVIELPPPAVQTDLTPGQSVNPAYMPLADFISQVMDLFEQSPTPNEICVENTKGLRNAERENRFDATLKTLNERMG